MGLVKKAQPDGDDETPTLLDSPVLPPAVEGSDHQTRWDDPAIAATMTGLGLKAHAIIDFAGTIGEKIRNLNDRITTADRALRVLTTDVLDPEIEASTGERKGLLTGIKVMVKTVTRCLPETLRSYQDSNPEQRVVMPKIVIALPGEEQSEVQAQEVLLARKQELKSATDTIREAHDKLFRLWELLEGGARKSEEGTGSTPSQLLQNILIPVKTALDLLTLPTEERADR